MSQMAQFQRKISESDNLYIPYLIFNPFLAYVANKCKICVAENYNIQELTNKESLFNE